jgi:hypothetical protein
MKRDATISCFNRSGMMNRFKKISKKRESTSASLYSGKIGFGQQINNRLILSNKNYFLRRPYCSLLRYFQ